MRQLWQWTGHQQAVSACLFLPEHSAVMQSFEHQNLGRQLINMPAGLEAVHGSTVGTDLTQPLTSRSMADTAHEPALGNVAGANQISAGVRVASASVDCSVATWCTGKSEPAGELTVAQDSGAITCLAYSLPAELESSSGCATLFGGSAMGHLRTWTV